MPSLVLDGQAIPILHVSQIAAALGLPVAASEQPARLGWELAATLDRWLELVRPLGLEALTAPTASRGRSVRNLTVNVFEPVALLPGAWATGRFDWHPEDDDRREGSLASPAGVVAYAERIAGAWTSFLLEREGELAGRNPEIASPRGAVSYSDLLAAQISHARFHLDQIEEHLGRSSPA